MAKKKGVRCIVTLECTEARGEGQTPSRYTTQKVWLTQILCICDTYADVSSLRYCHGCGTLSDSL